MCLQKCCRRLLTLIYERVWIRVWTWITTTWTTCTEQSCNWWCLCCNKWLCWVSLIIVAVLTLVFALVLTLVTVIWCVPCFLVCSGMVGVVVIVNPSGRKRGGDPPA